MLNNRLEDLIYKYKTYRIKVFIKQVIAIFVASIVALGLYSLYKKATKYNTKKEKIVEKNIKVITDTNKTKKPTIIKVAKKTQLNEDKLLKKNSLKTFMILEKKKPTYKTAMDLSRFYYQNKDYKKAAKWAVVASNREPKHDEAWLIYAKSKIKLGQKGMAKKALKIYLLKYRSREVSNLLNSL